MNHAKSLLFFFSPFFFFLFTRSKWENLIDTNILYTHTHDFDDNELPPKCYKSMGFFKNKKFCTPNVEDINFIGFQSIISWSPWKFPFFALNPLEIHVFPQSFGIRPEIRTTFTPFPSPPPNSSPWNLISSTGQQGGYGFLLENPNI